jgi:hypothetical protein
MARKIRRWKIRAMKRYREKMARTKELKKERAKKPNQKMKKPERMSKLKAEMIAAILI